MVQTETAMGNKSAVDFTALSVYQRKEKLSTMKVPKPQKMTSGNWYIRMRLGGESISVVAPTKQDCIRKAEKVKATHRAEEKHEKVNKADLTLEQALDEYIKRKEKSGCSPATIRGYYAIRKNRFQSVMKTPVRSIHNWQALYDADAEKYAPKTMQNTWDLISSAVAEVCKIAEPKIEPKRKGAKKEIEFLEPDEIKKFCAAVKGTDIEIPALLCLSSLRISELYGLTWDNIDLDYGKQGRIYISGASVYDKNNKLVDKAENKNETSQRYVKILSKQLKMALEGVSDKTGKVTTMHQNTLRRHLKAFCEQNKLTPITVHGLRHSFASLAYSLNIPIKVTMQMGGWKNYDTVLKIYTHLAQKDVDKYASEMVDFFNDIEPAK